MSAIIVVAFRDAHRAAEVLVELRRREWDWVPDLDHAVVVACNPQGNLRVQLNVDPRTQEGGAWARLWGSLLHSALLVPTTDGMTDAAGDLVTAAALLATEGTSRKPTTMPNANWWKKTLCISDEFIRDVGAMVQPGDSAVFIFLQAPKIASVLKQLRNYGGTLLHTFLSSEQEERLRDALVTRN